MPEQRLTYRFLPWARRGYRPSDRFSYQPDANPTGVPTRPTVRVEMELRADHEPLPSGHRQPTVELEMIGPGRIAGIDGRQVIRMDPQPGTTDYAPNYLPTVEFASPVLPWLFSPVRAAVDGKALPWLALIVVERIEETRVKRGGDKLLPTLAVPPDELPRPDEAWAWAHVQVVGEVSDDALTGGSLRTRSRLIAPRHLSPKTDYIAAVVPLFEAGRLAGLGQAPPTEENEMAFAWTGSESQPRELPVYHSWEFSTGKKGDFEYLLRRLTPRNLSSPQYDVGYATIDVTDPGPEPLEVDPDAGDKRTVKLPGALRKVGDRGVESYAMREKLRSLLNMPQTVTVDDVTYQTFGPPIYGSWHALRWQLTEGEHGPDQWLYDLNLHPGYRIGASFGTQIVRDKQEQLMASAWEQVGQVREANRWLAAAQLSRAVMARGMARLEAAVAPTGWWLQFTAPAHNRLLVGGQTAAAHIGRSRLPPALLSAAFRRLTGPAGNLARRLDGGLDSAALVEEVAKGDTQLPAPDAGPDGLQSVARGADRGALCREARRARDRGRPLSQRTAKMLREIKQMVGLCLSLIELLSRLLDPNRDGAGGTYADRVDDLAREATDFADPFKAVYTNADHLPNVDRDLIPSVGRTLYQDLREAIAQLRSFGTPRESNVVAKAWQAIHDALEILEQIAGYVEAGSDADYFDDVLCEPEREEKPEPTAPDAGAVIAAFEPIDALIDRVDDRIGGIDLRRPRRDPFDLIMAYPKFPQPMYRDLKELSDQYLLPGVNEIPANTIGVLETNPQFIEAFMTGLNHEMASELHWRRYMTDRRGSYFRQFWDTSGRIPKPDDAEALKDITEIHTWDDKGTESPLGSNTKTGAGGDDDTAGTTGSINARVVLVIRGDLLRRYPNTTIYAAKAEDTDSSPDKVERVPHWAEPAETDAEVDTKNLRFPIFHARLAPDVTFLGFDLTTDEAAGDVDAGEMGWFFVFEEPPGEPHFGLDAELSGGEPPAGIRYQDDNNRPTTRIVSNTEGVERGWQGLKWGHIPDNGDAGSLKVLTLAQSRPYKEKWRVSETRSERQWTSERNHPQGKVLPADMAAEWGRNGAHMAYILWQKPVRVAIHADDMLPIEVSNGGNL